MRYVPSRDVFGKFAFLKHPFHIGDVGRIPLGDVLVEFRQVEHVLHVADIPRIPFGNVPIERGVAKHRLHIRDIGDIPIRNVPIELTGQEKMIHVFDLGDIQVTKRTLGTIGLDVLCNQGKKLVAIANLNALSLSLTIRCSVHQAIIARAGLEPYGVIGLSYRSSCPLILLCRHTISRKRTFLASPRGLDIARARDSLLDHCCNESIPECVEHLDCPLA